MLPGNLLSPRIVQARQGLAAGTGPQAGPTS